MKALNGSGHSPANLSIEHVRSQGVIGNKIPSTNLNSVTVPGMHTSMKFTGISVIETISRGCCRLGGHCSEVRER